MQGGFKLSIISKMSKINSGGLHDHKTSTNRPNPLAFFMHQVFL